MNVDFLKKMREVLGEHMPKAINGRCVCALDNGLPLAGAVADSGTEHDLAVRYPAEIKYPDYQVGDFISKPMCEALGAELRMAPVQFMAFCASNFYHGGGTRLEAEILRLLTGQSIANDMQGQDGHIQDHIVGHEQRTIYNQ